MADYILAAIDLGKNVTLLPHNTPRPRPVAVMLRRALLLFLLPLGLWGQVVAELKPVREYDTPSAHVADFYNLLDSQYSTGTAITTGGVRIDFSGLVVDGDSKFLFKKNNAATWSPGTDIYFNEVFNNTGTVSNSGAGTARVQITHNMLIGDPYFLSDGDLFTFGIVDNGSGLIATDSATVLGGGFNLTFDVTKPTILSVTSTPSTGTQAIGEMISIEVNFSENVTLGGGGSLETLLNTGDVVSVPAGAYNTTASADYTVGTGDEVNPLNNSTISITASSITDAAGNVLSNFAPAAALSASSTLNIDGVRPFITSVTSTTSNGSYGIGDVIAFRVDFSETTVVANDNLQVTFETGDVDRSVVFTPATYLFVAGNYTIVEGDNSSDLATSVIEPTGSGTVKDLAGNSMTDFIPVSLLSSTSSILVDGIRPTLLTVTSSTGNGTYGIGDNVSITLNFSENVNVSGGNVEVTLETGATDQIAFITPFSNSSSGTGTYMVILGDVSGDLTVSAVADPSTALRDLAGNTMTDFAIQTSNLAASKDIVIDGVRPTVTSVTSLSANANYGIGAAISIQVTMSEPVTLTVAQTLDVTLANGGSGTIAAISPITNSSTAVGIYTVAEGDVSADLDAASLGLSGGTLEDAGGNNIVDFTIPGGQNISDSKALVVDGVRPTITGIRSTDIDATYAIGAMVNITIDFSEAVTTAGGGSIVVQLETGPSDQQITISGVVSSLTASGTYTVLEGHTSADLSVTSVSMSAGTLEDDFGNAMTDFTIPANLNLDDVEAIVIDGIRPVVSGVSSAVLDGSYKAADVIDLTVTFDDAVTVGGTPTLNLDLGGGYLVNYLSGTTTTVLTFRYTVQAGQTSADLAYVDASSLLAGASIKDASGNDATLTLATPGMANSLSASKDIIIDTQAPAVVSVTASALDGSYTVGVGIPIFVLFDEAVDVTGTPQITVETGASDGVADYVAGSGSTNLQFNYWIAAGENTTDLDYTTTTALALNGGTIRDVALNDAVLTLATPGDPLSIGGSKDIIIDTTPPTVVQVTSPDANQYYLADSTIDVQVDFSEKVYVGGSPQLTLETGGSDAVVNYTSGSTDSVWIFQYTVAIGHETGDLEYVATNSLAPNGGTVRDLAGNDATLALPALGGGSSLADNKDLQVDGIVPTVSLVAANKPDGIYKAGVSFDLVVAFSEIVIVDETGGTPTLTLDLGAGFPVAYTSGSASDTLKFQYTIQAGHDVTDLAYASTTALALNLGTIRDIAGNDATLTLDTPNGPASLSGAKAIDIDTVVPTVLLVSSEDADGAYMAGDLLAIDVVFDEDVTVAGGPPLLVLETGATDPQVSMSSGSGSDTLTFNYTVSAGETSADLDYITGTPFLLNAATITDVAGNVVSPVTLPAAGASGSLGDSQDFLIDTTPPTVLEVISPTTDGSYNAGSAIAIEVVFDEDITVGGTPQITLETGASDAVVDYTSGSANDTILFVYTVAAGETSADLDFAGTTSLALNGGTLADPAGNAAVLTLASPGGAGSLALGKALIIDTTPPSLTFTYSDTLGMAGDTVLITATADEALQIAPDITLTYNPTVIGPATLDSTSTTVYTYEAILPTDNSGTVTLTLTSATDLAGNALPVGNITDPDKLVLDNVAPGYTVAYSDSLARESENIDLTFVFEEPLLAIPRLTFDYAGSGSDIADTPMVNIGQDTIWTFQVAVPAGNDGFATVTVDAKDLAGNTVVHISGGTNTFKVDNIAPVIAVTSPAASAYVKTTAVDYSLGETLDAGTITWTWLANAGVSDGATPHVQVLTAAEIAAGLHSGVLTSPPPLAQGGEYRIEIIGNDAAGNADTASVTLMTYDTLAPLITGASLLDAPDSLDVDSTRVQTRYRGSFSGFTDPASPIALYEYALGTTAGDSDVVDWTGNGIDTTFTITQALIYKQFYYSTVRATDAAGNRTAAITSDGVRIIDKARLTIGVVQNSALDEHLQVMVIDTLAMANSITLTIGGTAATLAVIDSFTYLATHKLDSVGTFDFVATGSTALGDTSITVTTVIALALAQEPWSVASLDGAFAAVAPAGAVPTDRLMVLIDSTGFGASGTGGMYRLGSPGQIFDKPVKIHLRRSASRDADSGQAIYILEPGNRWQELLTVDEGGRLVAWTRRAGEFRRGPRTIIVPLTTSLQANYPNPFNPETHIVFDLGLLDGPDQQATVVIYNLLGQRIATLVDGALPSGRYDIVWDGRDQRGRAVSSGIYFVRLETSSGRNFTHKMALVR